MSLWRIRIAMSDDRRSQELLGETLAGQRVCSRLMHPNDTEIAVDMILELTDVSGLGALLGELHVISPQVFVSSADQPSPLASATAVPVVGPQPHVIKHGRVPAIRRAYTR
jgi:hypothetical protein